MEMLPEPVCVLNPPCKPGGRDIPGASHELCVLPHALIGNVARSCGGFKGGVGGSFDVIVDADVVHPFLVLGADADCVSVLFDGWIRHDLVHLRLVRSLLRAHAGMDLHRIRRSRGSGGYSPNRWPRGGRAFHLP